MTYTIVKHSVPHSNAIYTGIRCNGCKQTSYSLDDIEKRFCPFCKNILDSKQLQKRQSAVYTLYWGLTNKSHKAHWSVNGKTALCMSQVSAAVEGKLDERSICVNCASLKDRGFVR